MVRSAGFKQATLGSRSYTVTLRQVHGPQFPHLENGDENDTSQDHYKD